METARQTCIVVLGMHRSGTSAITGALHLLGVDVGRDLMRAQEQENPKGFFEHNRIRAINDAILSTLHSSWDDILPLPELWWQQESFAQHTQEITDLLYSEFGDSELFCLKDPRLCYLLPLWQQVFREARIEPVYLVMVRHPLEIAASLARRDNFPQDKSCLLWMNAMLHAQEYTQNTSRMFVAFEQLLSQPEQILQGIETQFSLRFPRSLSDQRDTLQEFLDPALKHHTFHDSPEQFGMLAFIAEYFVILQQAALRGNLTKDEYSRLTRLRQCYFHTLKWIYPKELRNAFDLVPDVKRVPLFSEYIQLYVDTGTGFYETQSFRHILTEQEMYCEFDMQGYEQIQAFRLDPANNPVVVKIHHIELVTQEQSRQIFPSQTNATFQHEHVFVFDTSDPNIFLAMPELDAPQYLRIQLEYLAWGSGVFQYLAQELHAQVTRYQQQLETQEREFQRQQAPSQLQSDMMLAQTEKVKKYSKLLIQQERKIKERDDHIQAIQRTFSWRLTAPLRRIWLSYHLEEVLPPFLAFCYNLLCFFNHTPEIIIQCDQAYYSEHSLTVTGCAIARKGIHQIEVYLNGILQGHAHYGSRRTDIQKSYPHITDSLHSGFSFQTALPPLSDQKSHFGTVVIRATDQIGQAHEISWPLSKIETSPYQQWIAQNEPDADELASQRQTHLLFQPTISILTPIYNPPRQFLVEMLDSVVNQTYSHWELCLADGNSQAPYVKEILQAYTARDPRIKVTYLSENRGIAGNSNAAMTLAHGEFITLLDHDDTLAPFALFEAVTALNHFSDADYLYSDEDKIDGPASTRCDPFFKPDWSPDMLRSYNYCCHLSIFRTTLFERIGGFREGFDDSQDYDLILRATEQARRIVHIPQILYHWRKHSSSTAQDISTKSYALQTAKQALQDHLGRIGIDGQVHDGLFPSSYKIIYSLTTRPKISIIIPNRDHANDLELCIRSILATTRYKNYEILIIENSSRKQKTNVLYQQLIQMPNIRLIRWEKSFNYSAINNFAAEYAYGDVFLFLNNDIEVINADWLERMLEHAVREKVGAVGAKLYYPNETIQHAGVIIGLGGVAGHSHKGFPGNHPGYCGRLQVIQNLSAVTAACLMMRKQVFYDVDGFDERYQLAFNDVDLCLKIRQKGYLIVWTPYAELYHHESKTRGYEDTPKKQTRFLQEVDLFQQRWQEVLERGDPYYSEHLTLECEDFSIHVI